MSAAKLVEPGASDPFADCEELLAGSGVTPEDRAWLTKALVKLAEAAGARTPREPVSERVEDLVRSIKSNFATNREDRPSALFGAFCAAARWFHSPQVPFYDESYLLNCRPTVRAFLHLLDAMVESGTAGDLREVLPRLRFKPGEAADPFVNLVLRRMAHMGLLRPAEFLDWEAIRATERVDGGTLEERVRPANPDFWLGALGRKALPMFLPTLRSAMDEDLPALAAGVMKRIARWGMSGPVERPRMVLWMNDDPFWTSIEPDLVPFFEVLDERLDRHAEDLVFLGSYWWFARRAFGYSRDRLVGPRRRRVLDSALGAMGRLRKQAREADAPLFEAVLAKHWHATYLHAVLLLQHQDSLWAAYKPLLYLFRSLRHASVAPDLRSWVEPGLPKQPPPHWAEVPGLLMGIVHGYAAVEEIEDRRLTVFREEFARFCLDRLKSRDAGEGKGATEGGKESGPVEPSPIWRLCYVKAFRELRVNPESRGHRTLHWAAEHDPDSDVKKEADIAYRELRGHVGLAPGVSARRAVFAAFWWLRQAHLLDLDLEVDPKGARRTRQKEARRTQERVRTRVQKGGTA